MRRRMFWQAQLLDNYRESLVSNRACLRNEAGTRRSRPERRPAARVVASSGGASRGEKRGRGNISSPAKVRAAMRPEMIAHHHRAR